MALSLLRTRGGRLALVAVLLAAAAAAVLWWAPWRGRPWRAIYLATAAAGVDQLYSVAIEGGEAVQISNAAEGVTAYAVAPDGRQVAFVTGSEIWLMTGDGRGARSLFDCRPDACRGLSWSPDGERVLYTRRAVGGGAPRLWWATVDDGETVPVFADPTIAGELARWSPDGRWLSYLAPEAAGLQLYDLETGEQRTVVLAVETAAVWSPDGSAALLVELAVVDERLHGAGRATGSNHRPSCRPERAERRGAGRGRGAGVVARRRLDCLGAQATDGGGRPATLGGSAGRERGVGVN